MATEYVYDCGFVMHAANNGGSDSAEAEAAYDDIVSVTDGMRDEYKLLGRLIWNEIGDYMAAQLGALPSELT